jgi:phosphocarrier protein HPr
MPQRTATVASSVGLHARPASLFSQAAGKVGVPVTLTNAAGKTVNAASILGVLSLGVAHGEVVTIAAEGDDAESALDSLAELLNTDFDSE